MANSNYQINLLPWRQRQQRMISLHFLLKLITLFCLSGVVLGGVKYGVEYHIAVLHRTDEQLEREIKPLVQLEQDYLQLQTQVEQLRVRAESMREYQQYTRRYLQLFELLSAQIPETVWLEKIHSRGSMLQIEGIAPNFSMINTLVYALRFFPQFTHLALEQITPHDEGRLHFLLRARWREMQRKSHE